MIYIMWFWRRRSSVLSALDSSHSTSPTGPERGTTRIGKKRETQKRNIFCIVSETIRCHLKKENRENILYRNEKEMKV